MMGTRPFYAWTFRVRPEVWVRLVSTFLSLNSHLNALRIHQIENLMVSLGFGRGLFFARFRPADEAQGIRFIFCDDVFTL